LRKTGQINRVFREFCGKNNDARQKIPKTGDTLKNIVVAQVTVPQKKLGTVMPAAPAREFFLEHRWRFCRSLVFSRIVPEKRASYSHSGSRFWGGMG